MQVLLLSAETATLQAIALLREFKSGIGYLRKDEISDAEELEKILSRLLSGEQVVGRSLVERLLGSPAHEPVLDQLTAQEKEVLRLMAEVSAQRRTIDLVYEPESCCPQWQAMVKVLAVKAGSPRSRDA